MTIKYKGKIKGRTIFEIDGVKVLAINQMSAIEQYYAFMKDKKKDNRTVRPWNE